MDYSKIDNATLVNMPKNVDLERRILAFLMAGKAHYAELGDLSEDDFSGTLESNVFEMISMLGSMGQPINQGSVSQHLGHMGIDVTEHELDELIKCLPPQRDRDTFKSYLLEL